MIQLGPFAIEHPFILAPMAGITNSPFRRLMRKLKSPIVISELVSANGIEYGGKRTLDLLRFEEDERIVGLQIFGEDPNHLVKACQVIERLGADFVDLNLGCPVPKVVKKGAGSAMCRNPVELGRILSLMVKSIKIPVTIKIRTGWDSHTRNALDVVRAATDAGVAWVAIHGRTRAQGYSGEADWAFIGDIKAKSKIPVIGNGDLTTADLAVQRYKEFGTDAVLIGRGALRNPFIFEQSASVLAGLETPQVSVDRYLSLLSIQREYLESAFDSSKAMVHARKFLSWYSSGFPGCHEFRKKVFSIPDPETLWSESTEFFKLRVHSREMAFLNQPFLMGGHG